MNSSTLHTVSAADYSTFDEALEMLRPYGTEFAGGLANHGPMAAEALCAMGRNDAVAGWVGSYRRGLALEGSARERIPPRGWESLLGNYDRVADWIAFFDNELADAPWQSVLDTWVHRLAPGIAAAATHGAIRTGHAARALSLGENAARRHELARGLGYWAARYQTLPQSSDSIGHAPPSRAIDAVELLPVEKRRVGLISTGLAQLDGFAPFAPVAASVDVNGDPASFLSDLTATFANIYLANAIDGLSTFAFIHSVTAPNAVRMMTPYLSASTTRTAMKSIWQACAAMYAAFGSARNFRRTVDASGVPHEELIERAIANGDEHAIKMTEACLREFALKPDPAFIAAAENAIDRLIRR